jgi:hypothetical protein
MTQVIRPRQPNRKQIKINNKVQFLINLMLNNNIKKRNQLKNSIKNDPSQSVKLMTRVMRPR